jgi:integrase
MWLAALEREHAARYVARHRLDVRYLLGVFRLPTDATDEAWQASMRDLNEKGLAWSSLRHATVTLRHLLRFCASLGALAIVPEIRPPPNKLVRRTEAKRGALSESERDRVLAAMRKAGDHRAARIWQAMAYSGLRKGELGRLTLRWLNTDAGILRIPAGAAKSGEEETIPLHPKARQAIRAEASERGLGREDRDVPVFGGFDIRKAWGRALARARIDVPGLTAHHSARHTFGTILAQLSRGDVTAVQAGGRWRSLSMVQRYVHSSAERARAVMKRM